MVTTLNFATATMVELIYLQEFSEQTHLVFIEERHRYIVQKFFKPSTILIIVSI